MSTAVKATEVDAGLMETISVAHIARDREFQCNLRKHGISNQQGNAIAATIGARSGVSAKFRVVEGWLVVNYDAGKLSDDKLVNYQQMLSQAVKQQVARVMIRNRSTS